MYNKISIRFILLLFVIIAGSCGNKEDFFPKISGHRGAASIAPENTLASIDSCIKYKIDLAECDVCISKDSVFYLLHGSTLDRTTNGTGAIFDWMSCDIDTLDAGSWFHSSFKDLRVPRLTEVLRKAKQGGLELTIDYRNGDVRKLIHLVRMEEMLEHCTFVFSSEDKLIYFRTQFPEVKRLQGYIRKSEDLGYVVDTLKPDIAVIRLDSVTPQIVSRCHKAGIKVLALALNIPNPDEEYHRAADLGIDVFATDCPEYIVKRCLRK